MHALRLMAAAAILSACLGLQACSDSDETDTGIDDSAPAVPGSPQNGLPAPPPPPVPDPKAVDACSVLNVEEVQTVIGHAMDGPDKGPKAGGGRGEGTMTSCSFASHSDSANAAPAELLAELDSTWYVNVTVWVWPESGRGAPNFINAMRDAPMTDDPVQEVEGIADEAVWNGALHARQDNITVSLDVRPAKGVDDPDEQAKERQLMGKALERL